MDRLERIRERRDEYESAMDEAERLRDEYHREIVKLHRSGMSLREIAEGLGISHQRVHQIVSPLEDGAGARRGRGRSIGAAGTIVVVLVAGCLWLSRPQGDPVVHRASPAAGAPSPALRVAIPCLTHFAERSSFSLITVDQCSQRTVMILDPQTGRILAYGNSPGVVTRADEQLEQDLGGYLKDLGRG